MFSLSRNTETYYYQKEKEKKPTWPPRPISVRHTKHPNPPAAGSADGAAPARAGRGRRRSGRAGRERRAAGGVGARGDSCVCRARPAAQAGCERLGNLSVLCFVIMPYFKPIS